MKRGVWLLSPCYALSMSPVGFNVPRADGPSKVRGDAQYVDDIRPAECLYGATVRSPRAHAKLLGIKKDPDFDWHGITIVTAKDIPAQNVVFLMTEDQPALADGVVRHVEEPVALVAADSRDRALDAVRHITVLTEDLPAILDPTIAEGNETQIYGEDNVFKRISIHKGGDASGGRRIEGVYRVGLQEQLYIEPQGMIAIPREDAGFTIVGSMQCPFYIEKALAPMLGHKRMNVIQAATGGGFGGKEEYPSMVAAHAVLLSIATRRPIKMIYRRDEDLRATTKRHPSIIKISSVVDDDGNLLQWDADILMDGGAYNTLTPVVLSRALLHLTGPYRCPNQHLEGVAVATNTPPNGAFRGFGAPQAMWAVERHMDRIAREMNIDPVTIRRRNLLRDGDTTPSGQALVDTGALIVLDEALAAAEAPVNQSPIHPGGGEGRYARGRGVSLVFHGCGFTGNGEARIKGKVALELEGRCVKILTASTDIGQGVDTTFPQIAAGELGIEVDRISNAPHDTANVPNSGPTVASRTCMVVGGVVQKAARQLREALQKETGVTSTDFDVLIGKRTTTDPIRVLAEYQDDGSMQWDDQTYQGDAYPTYGWSCSVVDLDVDLDTGEVLYRRHVGATDVGKAINPVIVAGQLEGGCLQALGYATCEEVVLDDQGRMINDRLTNYIIPTSLDAPEMITRIIEIPFTGGPFGAKGIGEIPMDGPAPATAQAIEQATGIVLDSLPMTPERIMTALEASE
jgi:CO/xanthine dehydrogenase Mo-binding subunit